MKGSRRANPAEGDDTKLTAGPAPTPGRRHDGRPEAADERAASTHETTDRARVNGTTKPCGKRRRRGGRRRMQAEAAGPADGEDVHAEPKRAAAGGDGTNRTTEGNEGESADEDVKHGGERRVKGKRAADGPARRRGTRHHAARVRARPRALNEPRPCCITRDACPTPSRSGTGNSR